MIHFFKFVIGQFIESIHCSYVQVQVFRDNISISRKSGVKIRLVVRAIQGVGAQASEAKAKILDCYLFPPPSLSRFY